MLQSQGVWTGGFVVVVVFVVVQIYIYIFKCWISADRCRCESIGNKMNCEQNETKRIEKQNSRKETSERQEGSEGMEGVFIE